MGGNPRTNSDALSLERGAQPEASTASEGSVPNRVEDNKTRDAHAVASLTTFAAIWPGRAHSFTSNDGDDHRLIQSCVFNDLETFRLIQPFTPNDAARAD